MPPVHRNTDKRSCGASTIVRGNSTVFVNNLLCAVKGDPNTHGRGDLLATVNPGTVFVENKELVVQGSSARPDTIHSNPRSADGSPDVNAF